ncbi:hypothetical protein HK14_03285 [Acetobacter cibinongensis]|uniref:Uncharacterized protein n=1 Tax=Acetobacter cibinongensis TaxID=146475 RepID=A0A1Z5YVZ8_9PROT|nr:hypothetical protein HK14_03285 [Acetobacter cibinongensis]
MLRDLIVGLLQKTTDARANVFAVRTAPTLPAQMPAIYVTTPSESGQSSSRGTPDFTKTVRVEVLAKVSGGTPEATLTALERIAEQIEMSVMCSPVILNSIQQVSDITIEQAISSETEDHLGAAKLTFGLEYTQEYPVSGPPLTEIQAEVLGTQPNSGQPLAFDVTLPQ